MPVISWKMAEPPVVGNRYLALISYLPLKHFRAVPKFFQCTFEIQRQLRTLPGLIGYSLEAQPLVMQELAPHLGKSQFVRWTVGSQEIPLDWNSAKARITQS